MRFRVLLEIDAPDPGTKADNSGTVVSPDQWIWQDFFKNKGIVIRNAIIIKPGFCGNCERPVAFFDYLCPSCRESASQGTPR